MDNRVSTHFGQPFKVSGRLLKEVTVHEKTIIEVTVKKFLSFDSELSRGNTKVLRGHVETHDDL